MNEMIKQNITFKHIKDKDSINDGICSVVNCNGWGTHDALVKVNGTNLFISFCKKHADEVENTLVTSMCQHPYFDGVCAEESCEKPITRVGMIEINNLFISINVCENHAKHIGNIILNGEEVIKIPTFKCIPRIDFEGGMMFFCPHCQEWHKHSQKNGHRVAHCSRDESPLKKTGYIIEMMPYDELIEVKEAIDLYLEFEG
ncbi:hypothetical protein V7O61_02435 [Methanolobus sp. WCC1]|uniref:hypothetical protein n=1 Tax=unclassified Methanolobus TaxID=2629569 RepID=UPI00324A7113